MDEPNKNDENRPAWPIDANFQEIFYQSPIGIFFYDKNGRLINANDSALNITRIPKLDDVLGTNIFDNPKIASRKEELHEKSIIKFKDSLNLIKIKELNIYNPLEQKLICIDWTVSVTDSGYLIQIQDITDNKKVVEIIQESDATYPELFELLDEAIQVCEIVFDDNRHPVDNIILDVNPAYEKQTGLKRDEVIGRNIKDVLPIEEQIWLDRYGEVVREGKSMHFEEYNEGINRWFDVHATPLKDNKFAAIFIDITERKKTEEALRGSEERLSSVLDNIRDVIVRFNLKTGVYEFVSPSVVDLIGYSHDEFINMEAETAFEMIHPDDVTVLHEATARSSEVGYAEAEYRQLHKNGEYIWVSNNISVQKDNSGKPIYRISSIRDINDRKKTEERLKESELKYRNLFDNLPLTTNLMRYVLNDKAEVVDWVFEDMNHMTQELLGQNREELKGKSLKELMGRNHIDSFIPVVNEIRRTGKAATQESHLEAMDMYHITTFAPLNNEIFLTIDQDITESKKAENSIRESEEKYRKIIELANEGIIIVDTCGMITYTNAKSLEMFGYTVEELSGINVISLVDKEDVEFGLQKVENRNKGIQESYEIKCRKKNDELLWCLVSATPMYDNNGKHVGNMTMLTDITERKNFEDHTQKLLEKEKQLTEELQTSNEELQFLTAELYKSNDELQKSTKLLSTVYELNPDAIVLTTLSDSKIIDCNQEYLNQIGYSREETIGHTSEELSLISEITRESYIDETRGKERVSNFEGKIRQKSGHIIDVMYSTRQITINNETIILNIGQDITKRKIQEEELRESKERLVLAQRLGNVGVWDWNTVTNKLTFTPELEQLYGLSPGTIKTYDDWRQLTHLDDIEKIEAERDQNIANHEPFDLEFRILHKSGEIRWLSAKGGAIYNNDGDVLRVLGVNTDITERKNADKKIVELVEELKQTNKDHIESEERFQDLADNIPNLAWMADAKGWIFWYNKQWYEYTGTTLDEMQGWGWKKLHHPDYVDSVTEEWTTNILEGEQYDNIFPLRGKDGNYRWFLTRVIPIKDEYGKIQRWFGTNTDVTERKAIEENLENTMDELKRSNKELEQFAYITSHDLREPLRMITSFLQLLEKRYKDQLDQDASDFIGFAVDGAKRLDAMTNDLLKYSKITNEKREIVPVDFEHVLEHALTNLKLQIEENNAIITHDPLPTINSDEQLKIQLFQNIIANAIKYKSQKTPKIHISAIREKNQYLFSIKDNGIGMSPEHLEGIFTIFKRLHTHQEYEGTGIGLAIAQKIVHQHGGQIWAESAPGKGTTFYFTIPTN